MKEQQLAELELRPGVELLEVGFGRGEFALQCAKRGARVSAIDYSEAALDIGRQTLADYPDADLRVADCKALPFEDERFERIYSGDVIEHVDFEDGIQMLREMWRVLRPGGFMFLHTSPNTWFTHFVLPLGKPVLRLIDANAVNTLEEHMKINETVHVHEYNLWSLRRVARAAGIPARVWIGADVLRSAQHRHTERLSKNPLVAFVSSLARLAPVRALVGNDLYLRAAKPAR